MCPFSGRYLVLEETLDISSNSRIDKTFCRLNCRSLCDLSRKPPRRWSVPESLRPTWMARVGNGGLPYAGGEHEAREGRNKS